MRKRFSLIAILALGPPGLVRADPDAVLQRARGRVQINPGGDQKFESAGAGAPLVLGDMIRTLKDASAHVVFANGNAVLVKENSSFQLSGSAKNIIVSFSKGEFLIGLTRPQAPGESFEVRTPAASASIHGAMYWGRCDAQNGTTYQSFADALPIAAQEKTTLLEPGQSLHIPMGKPPEEPRPPVIALNDLGAFALEGSLAGLGDLVAQGLAPPPPEAVAALPAASQPAPASVEAHLPQIRVELHPFFRFAQTYDDNIYLVARDKPGPDVAGGGVVGSWISASVLGLNYAAPLGRKHRLQGTADLGATIYSKRPHTNNAYDNNEEVSYVYTGKAAAAKLSNAYQNTELPAFSELVARQRHWQDATKLTLNLAQDRLFVFDLDAQHTVVKYLDHTLGGLLNHYDQLFGGRVGIQLAPKTKAFIAYHRGLTHYSAGRNAGSKSHLIDAGVEGDIAERLKGLVQTGYQYRRYDFGAGLPGVARLWQTSVQLKFEASRTLCLNLSGFRNFSESTFGANRHYVASGASLAAVYSLRKFTLGLDGSVETDRYPQAATVGGRTAIRRDDLYGLGVNADYSLRKWLKAGVSFTRRDRFSVFSRQFNYADDRTSISAKAEF